MSPALDAGVVGNADAGQDGDLLAAQPGDPAAAVGGQPRLFGGDLRPAGDQELPDLASRVHRSQSLGRLAAGWETLPVPLSAGTLTPSRAGAFIDRARDEDPDRKREGEGLDENVTRASVSYKNRFGITIAADLYRPKDLDESQRYPGIVIGPPYSGVKEQGPGIYAQNMAKRGFVALAFDPSFNGYSGGEPRHASSPDIFVEDFGSGVDYLGTRSFVDRERIGAIGICGSGAFALSAAQVDRRIKAVVSVVMVDIARATARGPLDSLTDGARGEILDQLAEQRYTDFEAGHPALGPRGAPIGFDENTDPVGCIYWDYTL